MEEEPLPATTVTGGISRSGRIRKKSSKLRDYQSTAEDWDTTPGPGHNQPHKQQRISHSSNGEDDDPTATNSNSNNNNPLETSTAPSRSIYMSEKSSKNRVLMSDGTVQLKRQPRKDKGRTRITAYMLWARSMRSQMGDLDFGTRSQRLGELWANVPPSERLLWKRRVTQHNKANARQVAKAAAATAAEQLAQSKFLNKSRNSTTATADRSPQEKMMTSRSSRDTRRRNGRGGGEESSGSGAVGIECTDPINIAAHLKLLGDSLFNIGESLEAHEDKGRNSITGTVSVLLDSLLCSLVPLISLTTQIEGFGHRVEHLKEVFVNTLDNIAYVMPGLPY